MCVVRKDLMLYNVMEYGLFYSLNISFIFMLFNKTIIAIQVIVTPQRFSRVKLIALPKNIISFLDVQITYLEGNYGL